VRRTYRILYRLGLTPWDSAEIPAALTEIVGPRGLSAGRAVDLGCGTGRQARYLAAHGWTVTAVDYLAEPVATARRQDPDGTVDWRVADVTDPGAVDPAGALAGTATLIVDNGCLHGIPDDRRDGWVATVATLAAPGCILLVRAAIRRGAGRRGIGPRGIDLREITDRLGPGWRLDPSPGPGWSRHSRTA
jgi:2-polyprenyl-3-methyl-5-hydroxy-6-metoxy-1,4-benzoquinol methylase